MKILLINGSPKGERSNTLKLSNAFIDGIRENYDESTYSSPLIVERIDVKTLNIMPCLGCFACWKDTPGKCCIKDDMQNVIDLFKSNDSNCYVVELCADFEERLVRNKSENRLLHKESKRNLEWSEAEMRKTSEKYRLNSYDGESLPFENYIKIDNTTLAPDEVAKMIQTHFAIEGRKE